MNAQQRNKSLRLLYNGVLNVLWEECNHQIDELVAEKRQGARCTIGTVEECPCGCGLQNDICDAHLDAVRIANEKIPF